MQVLRGIDPALEKAGERMKDSCARARRVFPRHLARIYDS